MNQVTKTEGISYKNVAIAAHGGGGRLMPANFGEVVAFSEIMARSQHAIPKHLREVPGACLAVTMQALRWELDPFLVASKSYNVKDIIAYEAQLIAAVVHTRAPLKTRPDYAYTGEGQDRRCAVSALFDDGVTRSYESPKLSDITTKNSPLWKADPDQQLGYYSIRAFARRYCPEVILGVYTPEEAETFRGPDNARDVTPRPSLSERLANSSASGDGFSQSHVIREIGGEPDTEAQRDAAGKTPPPASTGDEPLASEREPAAAGSGVAQDRSESATPPNSSEHLQIPQSDAQADAPAADSSPDPAAGTLSDSSDIPADDEAQAGSVLRASPPSTLPQGWEIRLRDALVRARKPDSLIKYAQQCFEQLGALPTEQADKDTAKAIRAAFEKHFGDQSAIDEALRELI